MFLIFWAFSRDFSGVAILKPSDHYTVRVKTHDADVSAFGTSFRLLSQVVPDAAEKICCNSTIDNCANWEILAFWNVVF